jgi:hypothetical protein
MLILSRARAILHAGVGSSRRYLSIHGLGNHGRMPRRAVRYSGVSATTTSGRWIPVEFMGLLISGSAAISFRVKLGSISRFVSVSAGGTLRTAGWISQRTNLLAVTELIEKFSRFPAHAMRGEDRARIVSRSNVA